MRFEYESEEDAVPIKLVFNVPELSRRRVAAGVVCPPGPGEPVFVRDVEFDVSRVHFYSYPDNPELDWAEVTLA